jgi:hypothetical protein
VTLHHRMVRFKAKIPAREYRAGSKFGVFSEVTAI